MPPRTLPVARDAFVAAMKRETSGAELTRLVGVLDALIKWSNARPKAVVFDTDSSAGVLAFDLVGTKATLWSVRVARGDAPKLEIHTNSDPETRARIMDILNAHSRVTLTGSDRLRVGFGALKNGAAFDAVIRVLGELVTAETNRTAATPETNRTAATA